MSRKLMLSAGLVLVALIVAISPMLPASAQPTAKPLTTVYSNGPLVTHPGIGPGGTDVSRVETATLAVLGFAHSTSGSFSLADDFTVTGSPWTVYGLCFYAYQTGSTTTSTITGVYYQLYDGPPNAGGVLVPGTGDISTNRMYDTQFFFVYRDDDAGNLGLTNRPIMQSCASANYVLNPGTYWVEWKTSGSLGSGPWAPPISILGTPVTGNALQFDGATWNPATSGAGNHQQGLPFEVLYLSDQIYYPNEGEILISAGAPVVPYAAPGEYAQAFALPADYDGNGFDTYVITDVATVAGETWYAIFIGGEDYLWVRASEVTILR